MGGKNNNCGNHCPSITAIVPEIKEKRYAKTNLTRDLLGSTDECCPGKRAIEGGGANIRQRGIKGDNGQSLLNELRFR